MRILLAWAACSWSVRDVTTGYRAALLRAGHVIRDYRLDNRLELMHRAFPDEMRKGHDVTRMATENVLAEASYCNADLVLIVSGLLFHEVGLWLLQRYGIRTAVILTESPYEDGPQSSWLAKYPAVTVFTQERSSAGRYGWHYLPHAYDPDVHRPVEPDPDEACDALFVGTGFAERQRLFEGVNWSRIDLRLRGLFPEITAESSLAKYYVHGCVDNCNLPRAYAAAKIALNPHRSGNGAESINPRAYELAACGTFQVSDGRKEGIELFGTSVPTYAGSVELEEVIRYYLAHPDERAECAAKARERVQGQTFDQRVADLMAALGQQQGAATQENVDECECDSREECNCLPRKRSSSRR